MLTLPPLASLRFIAAVLLVCAGGTLTAPRATALSCVAPAEWFPRAEVVFVGRIADVAGDHMQFRVDEVWQGPDLAPYVWLPRNTDMDMWWSFSPDGTVPDGYSSPVQYVVATGPDRGVGPCSVVVDDGSGYGVPGADEPRPPRQDGNTAASGEGAAPSGVDSPPEEGDVQPPAVTAPVLAAAAVFVAGLFPAAVGAVAVRRRRRTS